VELLGRYSNWTNWTKRVEQASSSRRSATEAHTQRGVVRRLDPESVAALVAGYRAGATVYELAERFKIHRTTVSDHLYREGVKMRGVGLDLAHVERAVSLYDQGWSVARIGSQLGANGGTVWRALRAQGVQMRDTQGRAR